MSRLGLNLGQIVALAGSVLLSQSVTAEVSCQPVQGSFDATGIGDQAYSKYKRYPPTLWHDVLRRLPDPGTSIVSIQPVDSTLRFRQVSSSGAVGASVVAIPVECVAGRQVFRESVTAGAEGSYGTTTRDLQLWIGDDGTLIVHVVEKYVGKDFYIFPHTSLIDVELRFPKATIQR